MATMIRPVRLFVTLMGLRADEAGVFALLQARILVDGGRTSPDGLNTLIRCRSNVYNRIIARLIQKRLLNRLPNGDLELGEAA